MPTLVELRQEKGEVWDKAKALNDKVRAEKRKFTPEEDKLWGDLNGEIERLDAQIERDELAQRRSRELADAPPPSAPPTGTDTRATPLVERVPNEFRALVARAQAGDLRRLEAIAHPAYEAVFRSYLVGGMAEVHRAIEGLPTEQRNTLQADLFSKGGALIPPMQFIADLIKNIDDEVFVRGLATRMTVTTAEGIGAPSLDTDPADADWTSELKTGNEGTMAFGKRELRPHPVAKRVKVSNKLLRVNPAVRLDGGSVGPEGLVRGRLGYKFGITGEKAYLTGDGVQKPLGVFTAHADGIPTSRDVSADNAATEIKADNLFNVKYSIKAAYWSRLRWCWHRDAVKMIRKIKDGNGQYLWAPGLTAGQPSTILDSPYFVSEYAPNTFTTGLYVGIIGDWSTYWIVDALDLTIQRLVELYAENNETGYIGRLETDGAPVVAEAWARVKLA